MSGRPLTEPVGRRRYACGKRRYPTAAQAFRAVRRIERVHHVRHDAYRCPVCRGWHINTAADRPRRLTRRWHLSRCERRDDDDTTPWRACARPPELSAPARQAKGAH